MPKNDTRAPEVSNYDEIVSQILVANMRHNEVVFRKRLIWEKLTISELLDHSPPFCEFDFDAVNPQILTDGEKAIIKEYFCRGGFISIAQDVYPHSREEYWPIKSWPVIDFVTKELHAEDADFSYKKIDESHQVFRQLHPTTFNSAARNELLENPNSPDFTLVSYKGHPCALIYGNYVCGKDHWIQVFPSMHTIFMAVPEDYALNVNLYIYVQTH